MVRHKSAVKRAEISENRREQNHKYTSMMKTAIKRVRAAESKEKAQAELKTAIVLLDRLADKGVIHKNNAANKKSQLTRFVAAMKQ
jgi:small subunit ribosomal protein S20